MNCNPWIFEKTEFELISSEEETARRYFFDGANLLVTNKDEDGLNGNKMPLKHGLFYEGATIFRGINSKELIMKSDAGKRAVSNYIDESFNIVAFYYMYK